MQTIEYRKTTWNDLEELKKEYFDQLINFPDGFWDDMLWESEVYSCMDQDKRIGFCAIGNAWNGKKAIRAFYIQGGYIRFAQEVYSDIIKKFDIVAALVTSSDELHVCLAFEKMRECHSSFEMQAYNFVYGKDSITPKYDMSYFSVVPEVDYEEMDHLTKERWKVDHENPLNRFYCVRKNDVILGYGSVFPHKLNPRCICIGNYVLPQYRRQGIGSSIIINLCNQERKQGFIPTEGCAYHNHSSLATLKSSGYLPVSRLFYVMFTEDES